MLLVISSEQIITSSKLSLSKSLEIKLDTANFFAIRSIDGMLNYLIFNPTIATLYTDLNMNAKYITDVGRLSYSGGTSIQFLKADGTLDENSYLTTSLAGLNAFSYVDCN